MFNQRKKFVAALMMAAALPLAALAEDGTKSDAGKGAGHGSKKDCAKKAECMKGKHKAGKFGGVRQLSSLTDEQRKKIDGIESDARSRMKPLREQMQQLKGADKDNAEVAKLREQVRGERKKTWEAVKAVLTPEQLNELKSKRGEGFSKRGPGGGHKPSGGTSTN